MIEARYRAPMIHDKPPRLRGPPEQPTPGERLRAERLRLGLSLRDVQEASRAIAGKLKKDGFILPASRLHEFETKGVVPNIFRLYSLSQIYGCRLSKLLRWFGIPSR
jgi:hypothetical protein